MLLAFPWHDNADRILLGPQKRGFSHPRRRRGMGRPGGGWWAWVKADGPRVYVAECDGDRIHSIRRTRKLEQRSPGLVAVGNVEFSWSRVPRVAYDRAWQDAIDTCRAGQPSPVGEWISEAPKIAGCAFASNLLLRVASSCCQVSPHPPPAPALDAQVARIASSRLVVVARTRVERVSEGMYRRNAPHTWRWRAGRGPPPSGATRGGSAAAIPPSRPASYVLGA